MGADFLYRTFPRFDMNDDRKELIRKVFCELTVEDWENFTADFYEEDYSVEQLLEDIETVCSTNARDTAELLCYALDSGKPYRENITGGVSWGDGPTESYSIFERAGFFDSIYVLARKFAIEDFTDSDNDDSIRKRRLTMISSRQVTVVTVTDPDTNLPVEVEIHKLESGAMVGLDGAFLEQSDSDPFSPYDPDVSFKV